LTFGVDEEILKDLEDYQAKELLKSMLYYKMKKLEGYA
jgi:hypothetical protein